MEFEDLNEVKTENEEASLEPVKDSGESVEVAAPNEPVEVSIGDEAASIECESSIANDSAEVFDEPNFVSVAAKEVIVSEPTSEQILKETKIAFFRRQLTLALFGIFFSFAFGAGIIFSIIALVKSVALKKSTKSTIVKWTFWLSIVGLILNAFFIITLFVFMGSRPIEEPVVETP